MPLHRWSGIKKGGQGFRSPQNSFDLSVPTKFVSLEDARNLIFDELNNSDDSLFVVTPGVGKTHAALQAISKIGKHRIVIYAAFNKDLQKEAYDQICKLEGRSDGFYLLEARDLTCQRSRELEDVTMKGFSPSEILCAGCQYRGSNCEYYNQRREFVPGVYFVTLHMLQYLQDQIPTLDLIILDENLKAGLLLEDSCMDLEIKSVLKIVQGADAILIRKLLNMFQLMSTKMVESGSRSMIINRRKLTQPDIKETTVIELLSKGMNRTEDEIIASLNSLSKALDKLPRHILYRQGIDLNAVNWIKGLCSKSALSFVHISDNLHSFGYLLKAL